HLRALAAAERSVRIVLQPRARFEPRTAEPRVWIAEQKVAIRLRAVRRRRARWKRSRSQPFLELRRKAERSERGRSLHAALRERGDELVSPNLRVRVGDAGLVPGDLRARAGGRRLIARDVEACVRDGAFEVLRCPLVQDALTVGPVSRRGAGEVAAAEA